MTDLAVVNKLDEVLQHLKNEAKKRDDESKKRKYRRRCQSEVKAEKEAGKQRLKEWSARYREKKRKEDEEFKKSMHDFQTRTDASMINMGKLFEQVFHRLDSNDEKNAKTAYDMVGEEEHVGVEEENAIGEENAGVEEENAIGDENVGVEEENAIGEENAGVEEENAIGDKNVGVEEDVGVEEENAIGEENVGVGEENAIESTDEIDWEEMRDKDKLIL